MSVDAWFTLAVVIGVLLVLIKDLLSPAAAMFSAMVAVLAFEVVEPAEAFAGFANPAPVTIAALYVLARAVEKSGVLAPVVGGLLGDGTNPRRSLARMLAPTSAASGFLNNTPIVAMLVPQIERWADNRENTPSAYLMPISFAAILGGTLTLIGTATNVVVSGLLEAEGEAPLGFFEITPLGIPLTVGGLLLIITLAPIVVPSRRSPRREAADEARQFSIDMVVSVGGPLVDRTVEEAGLRHLAGVFLAAIERDNDQIAPVRPSQTLRGGDRLRFVGKADQVVDLHQKTGLESAEREQLDALSPRAAGMYEAVVGASSPLVGQTLKQAGFRARYQAVVMAIHRAGQRVDAKLGDVPLRVGDTLLILSDPDFRSRWRDRRDFLLISDSTQHAPVFAPSAWAVGLIAVGIIGVAAAGWAPLVTTALVGAALLVFLRILTPGEARDAVNLDVIVTIAAAFGLAAAMQVSGLADVLADGLSSAFGWAGPRGVLLGVVLTTVALTELVTNNAAALLMFPIAYSSAIAVGMDPRGVAIAVAITASASFLTPIGYQTNTMVYGPGGYRFTDYTRLGAPLTALMVATTVILVPILWPA